MVRASGTGLALKSLQCFLRAVQFCCAALVLAIFSYFLAALQNHGLNTDYYARSVEGISGIAALYTLINLLLLCSLAGRTLFFLIAILMDLAFMGAFIYVAYATRSGVGGCSGTVDTIFGTGDANAGNTVPAPNGGVTALPSFKQACQLMAACCAVSIVAIVFFLLSFLNEFALLRHHRREQRFGPSPANNYTAGSTSRRRSFWNRKHRKGNAALAAGGLAAEKHHLDSIPADVRTSDNTDSTAIGTEPAYNKYGTDGYAGPNSGYRNDAYSTTGVAAGSHPGYPTTTGIVTEYPRAGTTGTHDAGYRTANTSDTYQPTYSRPGEIPAREYLNSSAHSNF